MNDFGRIQLEKYGWKDGKGLGKKEDGIKKAIKGTVKFDKGGIGYGCGEEFSFQWWDHVFNETVKNIEVINSNGTVEVKQKKDTQKICIGKTTITGEQKEKLTYGSFVKTGTLAADGEMIPCEKTSGIIKEDLNSKASRHGITMNGKLMRLEQQERELKILNRDTNEMIKYQDESKSHKKKKQKITEDEEQQFVKVNDNVLHEILHMQTDEVIKRKSKKKKKVKH